MKKFTILLIFALIFQISFLPLFSPLVQATSHDDPPVAAGGADLAVDRSQDPSPADPIDSVVDDLQGGSNAGGSGSNDACQRVYSAVTEKALIPTDPKAKSPLPANLENLNDKIVVYLSERIERTAEEKYDPGCGKILDCLYGRVRGENTDIVIKKIMTGDFPLCTVQGEDGIKLLEYYAGVIYRWMAGIIGSVAILVIIVSGIQISMGGLSPEEVSTSKDRIIRSLVGLIVVFLSAFILYTINPIFFA